MVDIEEKDRNCECNSTIEESSALLLDTFLRI